MCIGLFGLDRERDAARTTLMCIVSTLHFLCKQGLAVRGHKTGLIIFYDFILRFEKTQLEKVGGGGLKSLKAL